jgi:hypothetical protein
MAREDVPGLADQVRRILDEMQDVPQSDSA